MRSKIHKYFHYALRFAKSPDKMRLVKELRNEMRAKGAVGGVRSLLHRKMYLKGNFYQGEDAIVLDILKLRKGQNFKLPLPGNNPKVSVIIPMYNQLQFTLDCIYAIYRNNRDVLYEVIVADDNSTEDSSVIATCFEHVRIIKNGHNLGFLENCNNAARSARGEYIVFLNNDTQVQEGWLSSLLATFAMHPGTGLAGSKLVYPDGRLQEAGGIIWQDGSGWNYGNGGHPARWEYNYVKEADYISGASIMLPRQVWEEMEGFDSAFAPAYCEDADLCFRLRQKGYKVLYQPASVVVHFEGITHGTDVGSGVKQYQVINQKKFVERWKAELQQKPANGENVFAARDRTVDKKHVMIIDHYLPQPDKDAGSRTISNFIDALLALDYCVMFLGENQNLSPYYQQYFQQKGVVVMYGHEFNFYDQSWKGYLREHANSIDAFLLSRSSVCMPVLEYLRQAGYSGKVMYYGHDLGFRRLEQEAVVKSDPELAAFARSVKAKEDYMYANSDTALYISTEEAEYLRVYISTPLHYVPPYFYNVPAAIPGYESRKGLMFVGGFNHPPNKEAVLWFLEEVYGELHGKGVPFTVAGSLMPKEIYAYTEHFPLLSVRSDVPVAELDNIYSTARISVVPLLSGAGVKGKVIEAMAKGVPVVGTDIAFEGMPKDACYLYSGVNNARDFARRVLAVYSDETEWRKCSAFGMEYVKTNYNLEGMKSVFRELIG